MPAANTPITWLDTYNLAVRVDALAVSLSTPLYEKLEDDIEAPFDQPILPAVSFTVEFQLEQPLGHVVAGAAGFYPTVVKQLLMTGSGASAVPLVLPAHLSKMAENGDLYFERTEDTCLCTTIFKLLKVDGEFRLEEVTDIPRASCSCQTLPVAQAADQLDTSQYIIPAAYAHDWAVRDFGPSDVSPWWSDFYPQCEAGPTDCIYEFTQFDDVAEDSYAYMSKAQRLMTGKLIWPMRAKWYQKIFDKLLFIIACGKNCGAKAHTVLKLEYLLPPPEEDNPAAYIDVSCPPSMCEILWTMKQNGSPQTPGCLTDSCGEYPWYAPTCEGTFCDTAMYPRVYARTLEDIDELITFITDNLIPYSETCSSAFNSEGIVVTLDGVEEITTKPGFFKSFSFGEYKYYNDTGTARGTAVDGYALFYTCLSPGDQVVVEVGSFRYEDELPNLRTLYASVNGATWSLLDENLVTTEPNPDIPIEEPPCSDLRYTDYASGPTWTFTVPVEATACEYVSIVLGFNVSGDGSGDNTCGVGGEMSVKIIRA